MRVEATPLAALDRGREVLLIRTIEPDEQLDTQQPAESSAGEESSPDQAGQEEINPETAEDEGAEDEA